MRSSVAPKRALAQAPSNIALVKYMGKKDGEGNLPENPSLSMTLFDLRSYVEVRAVPGEGRVEWVPEKPPGATGEAPKLSENGIEKFKTHFRRARERAPALLEAFDFAVDPGAMKASVEIRGTNTFPHGAGIASSASSFAALTLASVSFAARDPARFASAFAQSPKLRSALASLSREGSGSSCRSFEGPFVSWEEDRATKVSNGLGPLIDLVVIVARGEKEVGSSDAHRRVKSSPDWEGRPHRARARHQEILAALEDGDLRAVARVTAEDSADMHRLFETSVPAFSYITEPTRKVLRFLESLEDPELVITMDAGPNVHVLVPVERAAELEERLSALDPAIEVFADEAGRGPELIDPDRELA